VFADPQTSELAFRSPARRKLFAPDMASSRLRRCFGRTYVFIKLIVVLLKPCKVIVRVSQSVFVVNIGVGSCGMSALTAVMSPVSTVGVLILRGLWYMM